MIEVLVKLCRHLKRNTQRVPITLWYGQLWYIALILLAETNNTISNTANFVQPADPGAFTPVQIIGVATRTNEAPAHLTAADIATQQIRHEKQRQLYDKVQVMQTTIRNQLIEAIHLE